MVNTLGYFKYACKVTTIFAEKQISAQKKSPLMSENINGD